MPPIVKGKHVLDAISKLKEPAHIADIVNYLAPNFQQQTRPKLTKIVKTTLDAGVRFGYLEQPKDDFYAEDYDDEMSTSDTEFDDEIESGPSKSQLSKSKSKTKAGDNPLVYAKSVKSLTRTTRATNSCDCMSDDHHEDCCNMRQYRRSRSRRSRSGKSSRSSSQKSRSSQQRSRSSSRRGRPRRRRREG